MATTKGSKKPKALRSKRVKTKAQRVRYGQLLQPAAAPGVTVRIPFQFLNGIPEDHWPMPRKRQRIVYSPGVKVRVLVNGEDQTVIMRNVVQLVPQPPKPIDTLEDCHLANVIKFCLREAKRAVASGSPFAHLSDSPAALLAKYVPQWKHLLAEGNKRKLYIVYVYQSGSEATTAVWFAECMAEVVAKQMGGPPQAYDSLTYEAHNMIVQSVGRAVKAPTVRTGRFTP